MSRSTCILLAAAALGLGLPRAGSAQSISIVRGQGQIICNNCVASGIFSRLAFDPLGVKVIDANGNPMSTTVYWVVQSGNGLLLASQTQSTSDGISQNSFSPTNSSVGVGSQFNPYSQNVIVACISDASCSSGPTVTFYETQAFGDIQGLSIVQAQVLSPDAGTSYAGTAGSAGSP
ncbi:MAG TPA: hypothetical protein VGF59_35825, partial [Bryobacteraceae bacterium]